MYDSLQYSTRGVAIKAALVMLMMQPLLNKMSAAMPSFPSDLSIVGAARFKGRYGISLTPAKGDRVGAVWMKRKRHVTQGFETTFTFRISKTGGLGSGADGCALVLQNAGPRALGGLGSAGGFAVSDPSYSKRRAAIARSIAVFFDTYQNIEEGDVSDNSIGLFTYSNSQLRWPAAQLARSTLVKDRMKDGRVHSAVIRFDPPLLSIFLDDLSKPVLESIVDLSTVIDSEGNAFIGLTASTGGGFEKHDILSWTFRSLASGTPLVTSDVVFSKLACLPNRNLCTPEETLIEADGTGFHVVLPANRMWAASFSTRSDQRLRITRARGIVCLAGELTNAQKCSGPSGNQSAPRANLLVEQERAGALVKRITNGKIWISVNGYSSRFEDNQGFFQFDVEVQ